MRPYPVHAAGTVNCKSLRLVCQCIANYIVSHSIQKGYTSLSLESEVLFYSLALAPFRGDGK
jgi:hypothetical protein